MRKFRLLAAVIASLLLSGCPQPGSVVDLEATEVVNSAVKNRADLKSLTGRGEMRIADKGSDFSLSIKIEMVAQDPDHLRIRATKLADAIVAFDMLMQGVDVAFYVPTRNTLYMGNIENLQSGGVNFSPNAVIARMLRTDKGLLDRKWRIMGRDKDGLFSSNLVLEQVHGAGQDYVRLHVDGRNGLLMRVLHYDKSGKLFFEEDYNGYRQIMTGRHTPSGAEIGSGIYFPTRFRLSWPDKNRHVSVTLRDFEIDQTPEQLEKFWTIDDLNLDTVQRRNLDSIKVEGDPAGQ